MTTESATQTTTVSKFGTGKAKREMRPYAKWELEKMQAFIDNSGDRKITDLTAELDNRTQAAVWAKIKYMKDHPKKENKIKKPRKSGTKVVDAIKEPVAALTTTRVEIPFKSLQVDTINSKLVLFI